MTGEVKSGFKIGPEELVSSKFRFAVAPDIFRSAHSIQLRCSEGQFRIDHVQVNIIGKCHVSIERNGGAPAGGDFPRKSGSFGRDRLIPATGCEFQENSSPVPVNVVPVVILKSGACPEFVFLHDTGKVIVTGIEFEPECISSRGSSKTKQGIGVDSVAHLVGNFTREGKRKVKGPGFGII